MKSQVVSIIWTRASRRLIHYTPIRSLMTSVKKGVWTCDRMDSIIEQIRNRDQFFIFILA